MIFKYFSYDKTTKCWNDTKNYVSICPTVIKGDKNFARKVYGSLTAKRLISMPYDHFSISDFSSKTSKTYTLSCISNNKRTNFARLCQLPNKDNATVLGIAKSTNAFIGGDISSSFFTTRRSTLFFDEPPMRTIDINDYIQARFNNIVVDAPAQVEPVEADLGPVLQEIREVAAAPEPAIRAEAYNYVAVQAARPLPRTASMYDFNEYDQL